MPEAPSSARQCDGLPLRQYVQTPQALMQAMMTRSPTSTLRTDEPTSTTVPTPSWPSTLPSVTVGTSPLMMCRSVPQIVVVSTRTSASVVSTSFGSGTSTQLFVPGPSKTSAFIASPRGRGVPVFHPRRRGSSSTVSL